MWIWVLEVAFFAAFVGIGGFYGFIAWAVITALVMFAKHSSNQTKLKAAELMLREKQGNDREARELDAERRQAPRLPPSADLVRPPASEGGVAPDGIPAHHWIAWPGAAPLDFRTMMWGSEHMVRRISATEWQRKFDADYRTNRIRRLRRLLAMPHGEESSDDDGRITLQDELSQLEPEPTWKPFAEKYIAAIETRYQRYLARG
jgi:hypothetical protein